MARIRLNSVRNRLEYENARKIIKYLDSEGDRIMKEAYNTKETLDRSEAQKNAYGYRVYYNGLKKAEGFLSRTSDKVHKGWDKHSIPPNTGRGYLMDFFNSYEPSPKGFELIVVNAVYYTQILEDGMQNRLHTKYKIISQIRDEFENLQRVFSKQGGRTNVRVISPIK